MVVAARVVGLRETWLPQCGKLSTAGHEAILALRTYGLLRWACSLHCWDDELRRGFDCLRSVQKLLLAEQPLNPRGWQAKPLGQDGLLGLGCWLTSQ